jgi:hypothetical protein
VTPAGSNDVAARRSARLRALVHDPAPSTWLAKPIHSLRAESLRSCGMNVVPTVDPCDRVDEDVRP